PRADRAPPRRYQSHAGCCRRRRRRTDSAEQAQCEATWRNSMPIDRSALSAYFFLAGAFFFAAFLLFLAVLAGLARGFFFFPLPQLLRNRLPQIRRAFPRAHAGALQRLELVSRRPLAPRHDRARVTHALARRRRDARDVGNDRLRHVLADEVRCGLFVRAADL